MKTAQRIKQIFVRNAVANKLEAAWFSQGVMAAACGLSSDGLNRTQQIGYNAQRAVMTETRLWGGSPAEVAHG